MHWRPFSRRTAAGCGLMLALLVPGGAALAQPPVDVPPGERIVDEAGVLEDPAALEAEIRQLTTDEGITLTAVFVDSFTNPSDPGAWLQEFAQLNGFGSSGTLGGTNTGFLSNFKGKTIASASDYNSAKNVMTSAGFGMA